MGRLSPKGFRRGRSGQLTLNLDDDERRLLADLLEQLIALVSPPPQEQPSDPLERLVGIQPDAHRPSDPALARLLPDAYDDPELAGEFRRYTERDLRSTKVANARTALATLSRRGTVKLTRSEAMCWLAALNDLRLALATRLGVTEDNQSELISAPDPVGSMYLVYDWLTYHQDRLVSTLAE